MIPDDMEYPEDLDLSVIDRRNFLLTLSPGNFDAIQSIAGFSSPSDEIRNKENIDVVSVWISLATVGILREVDKVSNWTMDFVTAGDDIPDAMREKLVAGYYSFAVSLLSHLLGKDMIHVHQTGDPTDNVLEFAKTKPSTFAFPIYGVDDDE